MVESLMDLFIAMEAKAKRMASASEYEPAGSTEKPGPKQAVTDEAIIEAYKTGLSIKQVAEKLKTGKSAVSRAIHHAGIVRPQGGVTGRSRPRSPMAGRHRAATDEQIIAARKDGLTILQIADKLNTGTKTIVNVLRK